MHQKRCKRRKRRRLRDSDENNRNKSYFENLSDEIVIEILIRLPREDAVRCNAVCKNWRALISDGDYFIGRYIKRQQIYKTHRPFSLVFQRIRRTDADTITTEREKYMQAEVISDNDYVRKLYPDGIVDMRFVPCAQRPLPFLQHPFGPLAFQLEACCNDLLLCSFKDSSTSLTIYHFCNIETRQWVSLPPIRMDVTGSIIGIIQSAFNSYDYRVAHISRRGFDRSSLIHSELEVDIFSTAKGRWTNSVVSFPRELYRVALPFKFKTMVACKGMLHLLTGHRIIVLDAFCESTKQVSRIIDLPNHIIDLPNHIIDLQTDCLILSSVCFGVSQGELYLAVMSYSNSGGLYVWELEDYEKGKWCMVYKILTANIFFRGSKSLSYANFDLLAFHPDNRNIIYLRINKHIAQCDMEKENKFDELYKLKNEVASRAMNWTTTFPLVHSWWPTPLPSFP